MKSYSRLLAWGAFWLILAVVVYWVASPQLPDVVAIHWDGSGTPDGSASRSLLLLAPAVALAVGLVISLPFRIGSEPTMESFALVGMTGGLGISVVSMTATANWGIADWRDASELTVWSFLLLFLFPMVGLAIGIVVGRSLFPLKEIEPTTENTIDIKPGERISWVGRARVRWVAMLTFGIALVLVFAVPDLPLWVFLPLVGSGLVLSQVEANVTNDGMRIRLGGIPVRTYRISNISSARVIELEPTEWGGWGWRFTPNRSAIVLRKGDAVELTLRSGRRFAVTVDDAATGAALVNGLVAVAGTQG